MQIFHAVGGMAATNIYLVCDEETKKTFIVDPGVHNKEFVNEIEKGGYSLEYIILTHGHGDHIGGVEKYLEEFPDAKLVAAKAEAEFLKNSMANFSRDICGRAISLEPDMLVEDMDTLKVGNLELTFLMTPGHTQGGMCIYVPQEKVVFAGDTLFRQSVGRTDFPGGSFPQLAESIRNKLYTLPDDTVVLPGHEMPTDIGFEKRNNPFV